MPFEVDKLKDYTEENESILVTSSVFSAKTQQRIIAMGNVMTGVKSSQTINEIDTDAVFQNGGGCGFNSQGSTKFSQREVVVGKIKVNESLCPKALEDKYTQKALPAGSSYDTIAFAEEYTGKKSARIAAQLEIGIWQGDKTSASPNLNKFDGLNKNIDSANSAVDANDAAFIEGAPFLVTTKIDSALALKIIDGVYKAIPVEVLSEAAIAGDLEMLCGWDFFRLFIMGLKNQNLYHYAAEHDNGEIIIPGTNIKLVALNGLNSTNRVYAIRWSNVWLGVDMLNEEEKFELFYAKEADEVRFVADWKTGVNVAFPNEVTVFKLKIA